MFTTFMTNVVSGYRKGEIRDKPLFQRGKMDQRVYNHSWFRKKLLFLHGPDDDQHRKTHTCIAHSYKNNLKRSTVEVKRVREH